MTKDTEPPVVDIRTGKPLPSLLSPLEAGEAISQRAPTLCSHLHFQVVIDTTTQMVFCAGCREPLSPYVVLRQFMQAERKLTYSRQKRQQLTAEVAQLKAEERRVKSRLNAARRKLKSIEEQLTPELCGTK